MKKNRINFDPYPFMAGHEENELLFDKTITVRLSDQQMVGLTGSGRLSDDAGSRFRKCALKVSVELSTCRKIKCDEVNTVKLTTSENCSTLQQMCC